MGEDKKTLTGCLTLVGMMLTLPIWFYLLYCILDRVDATTAMWAAYWAYVPVCVIFGIGIKIVDLVLNGMD